MVADNFTRNAVIRKVIDGDTIEVLTDYGYRAFGIHRIRLKRINAPEIHGESKPAGLISKAYVESILPPGTGVVVVSEKTDSFERWLGEVYYLDKDGNQINLSDDMVARGLAVPFMVDK